MQKGITVYIQNTNELKNLSTYTQLMMQLMHISRLNNPSLSDVKNEINLK